jgi:hypothetical protein
VNVEIPGVGVVEFPDDMPPEQIKSAAARLSKQPRAFKASDVRPFTGTDEPVEANPLLDPINLIGLGSGKLIGGAAGLLPRAAGASAAVGGAARAAGSVGARAVPALARHAGTAGGAAIGGAVGGPGGAALGGLIGRQVLSPATVSKLLARMFASKPPPALNPQMVFDELGSLPRAIGYGVRQIK